MALKPDDLPELPPIYLEPQIRARVHQNRDLFTLFVAAICVGLLAGAVAGSFRLCLKIDVSSEGDGQWTEMINRVNFF